MNNYLKKQIISYMGNKRKMVPHIEAILTNIKKKCNKEKLLLGDGFSGSGIVSRLFKLHAEILFSNDIAGYSKTLNACYLDTPSKDQLNRIQNYIDAANDFANTHSQQVPSWVRTHWAPTCDNIEEGERVYYTPENARRIDYYRFFIENTPSSYRPFLLAPLLVEASIHTNTSGQFAAFYKMKNKGHYGGKTGTDLKRITTPIRLQIPIFSPVKCKAVVSQKDTNEWVTEIPELDLVYYDPPYNKHPYSIYYFLLDIINNWDRTQDIPQTLRGQPKNWKKSKYNSFTHAKAAFTDLIEKTKSKFILLSYNDGGIIPLDEIEEILQKKGTVEKIPITHNIYNRMKGIANWKRKTPQTKVKEFFWLVDCRLKKMDIV
tara:strand:+ start:905 stop:2029 length:1125 start_codon:yes stop_codon:yes gene_type:complete